MTVVHHFKDRALKRQVHEGTIYLAISEKNGISTMNTKQDWNVTSDKIPQLTIAQNRGREHHRHNTTGADADETIVESAPPN